MGNNCSIPSLKSLGLGTCILLEQKTSQHGEVTRFQMIWDSRGDEYSELDIEDTGD